MAVLCFVVSTKETDMKVRLLNGGGYVGMDNVKFPVVVDADGCTENMCKVSGSELINAGACPCEWEESHLYNFCEDEFEVIE